MGEFSSLVVTALLFTVTGAVAFPQRTAYTNSTSSKATQTSSSSTPGTTPGPSLARSCGFWLPNEIFLNSWWTQHATFTVATEVDYYIQYNNTLFLANSTSRYGGITASYTPTTGVNSGTVITQIYTDLEVLATMGVLASMQWEFPGVPSNLISLLPSTTNEFTYAETRLHTYSDITTEWGIEATRTKTVVASPTPYAEPILGILNVKYLNESGDVVEAKNYTDMYTAEWTGGVWLEPDVDWPSKVYFDSIPPEFIEWVQRNASVASSFPWLNECTNYVGKRPTGAPTVHIVVSTLTHTTSSIIATRPGNFGGAVPMPSSKLTTKTSVQATSQPSTEIKSSVATRPQTTGTTAEKQTSTGDVERTSATTDSRIPTTHVLGTTVHQASPTSVEQASTTSAEQATSTASQQVPSTRPDQAYTTDEPTVQPSRAVDNTGSPPAAQPVSTENDGATQSGAGAVSDAASSGGGTRVSFVATIPTNGQIISSAGYTEPQKAEPTTLNSDSGPSTVSQDADVSQATSSEAAQSNKLAESSSESGTTIVAVAPVLTLDSKTITPNPSSEHIINSQTLAPGGPAITIGETTYSLAPSASAIIANGQTQSLAPSFSGSPVPQITLGSSIITANPTDGFVYASQTISAGGPAVTANGNTYSLAISESTTYIVENGITQQPATYQTAAPVLTFGSSVVTANSESVIVLGSQTLQAGGSEVVVGQTTYSLATSGSSTFVVQNGITSALVALQGNPAIASSAEAHVTADALSPKVTMDTGIVTQNTASEYMVAGQTLKEGGSAVEVEGTTYSLLPSASAVVVNGVTSALSVAATSPAISVVTNAVAPAITLGSSTVTPNAASEYVIGTQTLLPENSAIEVQGTTYSLAPSGTVLVVNGATSPLSASQSTAILIAGQTLFPGTELAVQGTTYSLSPSDTAILVNGKPSSLPTSATGETPLFVIGSTTLKPGEAVTVEGTTYSIPTFSASASGASSEVPVVIINGKTSTLPVTKSTGAAVLSGLQRTSASQLSGSRVTGSATATSTQGLGSADGRQSVASTSTAGVGRLMQKSAGDIVVALIVGVIGMVVF
ncbi:hypothetical protein KCU81_g1384, partial [Aureobasidium melanogenum]